MQIIIIAKLYMAITFLFITTSIYTITSAGMEGNTIHFSDYQGKKILIINTACNSFYAAQFSGLEQLYQKYKDSLVIVDFPSNSFGNEPWENAQIKDYLNNHYHIHFILAAKSEVIGTNQISIFQWLTEQDQNGMMNSAITNDFQKFLVDKDGVLIGVFSSEVDPMNTKITNAIEGH
jgi:glutathione peroxidase